MREVHSGEVDGLVIGVTTAKGLASPLKIYVTVFRDMILEDTSRPALHDVLLVHDS